MNNTDKKNTGSYYTTNSVADYIVDWAIDDMNISILEPSFGDGVFVDSAIKKYTSLGNLNPHITGIEKQKEPYDNYMQNHKIDGILSDFMAFNTEKKFDAIIGNPPYVSLRNLSEKERKNAINRVRSYGINMATSGSLWMPFMIHSTELLAENGKLGFVLPYEITYVRYAFKLWDYLSKNYGKITLCRIYHDFFPDVDVETVLFLAEEKGGRTDVVSYKIFKTIEDLLLGNSSKTSILSVKSIMSLEKPFETALVEEDTSNLLDALRNEHKIEEVVKTCKFKIGYVSGSKTFFNISKEDIQKLKIRPENTKKALLNARQINSNINSGIETGEIHDFSYLFYPKTIGKDEYSYIEYGEKIKVNEGYKCKQRKPWYIVPQVEKPDLVLTVFGDVPKLLLNNGEFYISNSLLGGIISSISREEFLCRWYNSLTLLSIETTIHSLGGGSLVLIPGETDNLEIISDFPKNQVEPTYQKFSIFAKKNKTEDIYKYGDEIVLKKIYGFTDAQINFIRDSVSELRKWRIPEKRRKSKLELIKNIPAVIGRNEFVKERLDA